MIYRKNVKSWEQVARVVAGVGVAAGGLVGLPGAFAGYAIAACGAFLALTGVFGYCPMCRLAGRTLETPGA